MKQKEKIFFKQQLKNEVEISGIYTIHYFRYGRNFKFKKESHNFYELVYIDSGNAVVVSNDKKYSLKQGQAFLHKPNDSHTIYTDNDFANSAIVSFESKSKNLITLCDRILTFDNEDKALLNKILNEAKLSYADPLNDLNLKKMNKRDSAPFGGDQIIKNCAQLLFVSLIRQEQTIENSFSHSVDGLHGTLVTEIITLLKRKLENSSHVNLEEISFDVNFSKSYIKEKFKKETGKSILQFFIDMKIEKAKKLLSHGDKTINEVSDELGFNSVQYFCRQFKMRTDMTPTTYINSIKTDHLI